MTGGAVVGRAQIRGVDQQDDRDELREHARGRARGARGREAAQVLEHVQMVESSGGPRRSATPRPSSAHVTGSIAKPAQPRLRTSTATKHGDGRAGERPAGAVEQRDHGRDQERGVDDEPDHALLGGDGDGSECETVERACSISS